MTHPHAAPEATPGDAAFLRAFAWTLALLLAAIALLTLLVDPLGRFGTGLVPPAITADRDLKARLYRALAAAPRLVVLGSSRSKTLAPACFAAAGEGPAFNFAVNGASAQDLVAIGRFLRAASPGVRQRLVVGLEPELLQGSVGLHRPLALSRALRGFLPELPGEADASLAADLFGWQAVQAALRSLGARLGAGDSLPAERLEPDGVQHYPRVEAARRGGTWDPRAAVEGSIPGVLARYRSFERLDGGSVAWLRQFLREAHDAGDSVIAFVPPVHPRLAREAAGTTWAGLSQEMVLLLQSLEREGLLRYVPTDDRTMPDDAWVDGLHFLAPVAAQVVQRLTDAPAVCAVQ